MTEKAEQKGDRRYWLPDITDFRCLFIHPDADAGFPDRSSILVMGAPGAGKTVFSLSIVRSLLSQHPDSIVAIVSHELSKEKLQRDYSRFGWFGTKDALFRKRLLLIDTGEWEGYTPDGDIDADDADADHENAAETDPATVSAVSPTKPPISRKRKGLGDLNRIVNRINRELVKWKQKMDAATQVPCFIVIDSLSALIKALCSPDSNLERHEAYEFILNIKNEIQPSLAIFTREQDSPLAEREVAEEEYITDFVFRLGLKETGAGRRRRYLEVCKSHGANMVLGEHSFSIVTKEYLNDIIAHPALAEEVVQRAAHTTSDSDVWGTVVISPRRKLTAIGKDNKFDAKSASSPRLRTGIRGLDALISGQTDYWWSEERSYEPALNPGYVTLILGASGTCKTNMCLQFLLADGQPEKSVYVNFERPPKEVQEMFPGNRESLEELSRCQCLYRRAGNLDFNLLLLELTRAITPETTRIAIDGLARLMASCSIEEFPLLVEALVGTAQRASEQRAPLFLTFELPPNSTISPSAEGLSALADNILVLRQIPINDRLRKTIHVLKARGHEPDQLVREIAITTGHTRRDPISIEPGFESYGNLMEGTPEPLSIVLQLFAENPAEREFNELLTTRLTDLFAYDVRAHSFSRAEITRTLDDSVAQVSRIPPSDIRILSLDEWWIREYAVCDENKPTCSTTSSRKSALHPLLTLNQFTSEHRTKKAGQTSLGDFWIFEVEKASVVHVRSGGDDGPIVSSDTYALPHYTDFGLFCLNERLWEEYGLGSDEESWPARLDQVPRVWAVWDGDGFKPPDPSSKDPTIVDLLARAKEAAEKTGRRFVGFASDMEVAETAVCTFFELCWSFGAPEDFLIRYAQKLAACTDETQQQEFINSCPATIALRFLQFLIENGLMSTKPTLQECRSALLSRLWYSTLCELKSISKNCQQNQACETPAGAVENQRLQDNSGDQITPVPFFPIGMVDDGHHDSALVCATDDAFGRYQRLVDRTFVAAEYRNADEKVRTSIDVERERIKEFRLNWEEGSRTNQDVETVISEMRESAAKLFQSVIASWDFSPGSVIRRRTDLQLEKDLLYLLPGAKSMDARDFQELSEWHKLRLDILQAELDRQTLSQTLHRESSSHEAHEIETEETEQREERDVTALTGYPCSGSWMIGALRSTQSPGIAWKMMEEIASRQSTVDRAVYGAGIPSRKDFFQFHGDEKVPHCEHMSWTQMLRHCGSRARRRDRTVCSAIGVAEISQLIYQSILNCISIAEHKGAIDEETVQNSAPDAVRKILSVFVERMEHKWQERDKECASCPYGDACKNAFAQQEKPSEKQDEKIK